MPVDWRRRKGITGRSRQVSKAAPPIVEDLEGQGRKPLPFPSPLSISRRPVITGVDMDPHSKVLIIVGDASETLDTLYPFFRLQEDGFTPVVAGPEKRRFQMVMHEVKPGWTITKEWEGYTIEADVAFDEINPEDYVGIMFSGGRAPEYIRDHPDLIRITQWFFDHDKPIASVCHGVEIPARADRVRGRKMATVPKCQFDLEICGGTFVNEACVIDGNLISGRTYHDNGQYLKPWIDLLIAERAKLQAQGAA